MREEKRRYSSFVTRLAGAEVGRIGWFAQGSHEPGTRLCGFNVGFGHSTGVEEDQHDLRGRGREGG